LKIFIYVYYFFRSAFLRGFLNTIALLKAELNYEEKFGIRTSAIKKSDSKEFFHYQGAGYLVLIRLFNSLDEKIKGFEFVDIGCGKGRAIFVAEYCGFNNLIGIELDQELVEEAKTNLELYSLKRKESFIRFIHANALEYIFPDRPTIYFLFNPFNEAVLSKVLDRIYAATSAETWFIYMNPLYQMPFKEKKMEIMNEFKTGRYLEAVIYRMQK
jgi:SAM-dependent methyltransferase